MQNDSAERRIALAASNEAKLEGLMDAYGDQVKYLIYSYVKDWGITSDLVQEVFVSVYMKLDGFEGRSTYKTWIYSIAINRAKDYLKSWHFRHMAVAEKVASFIKDSSRTPEDLAIENDTHRELLKTVWALPIKYREVILLHYYQELSVSEISEALGFPLKTIKTRLFRAKEKIRKTYIPVERGRHYESI
ncbi:sigma-70 family RNA polymerase sigma factor [Bacillus sp. CGMCC 1.16607]|uniref:sigma-70 family RNA polymerase sigma factor n=1 Tax=Bacillus sp. CGMCC 1.16607 TaxID=3351842 RepID=UPI003629A0FF